LVKRYKRFLADVTLDTGETITAHCANPGAMTGLKDPGLPVYLSTSDNPKRKLKFSLEAVEINEKLVGIDTSLPNRIVEQAIASDEISELTGYGSMRREVKYGENSRIDLLLESEGRPPAYVEVKSVTLMRQPGLAEFPDSVTTRGTKHLHELARMAASGHRAVMLYLVQRMDCETFSIAADIDPDYAKALEKARDAGVETLCYDCQIDTGGLGIRRSLPLAL